MDRSLRNVCLACWTSFLVVWAGTAAATGEWTHLGPYDFGARVLSLAIDPTDPNHVFAGSASGGLWETKDPVKAGWHYVKTGFPVLGVGAVAFHPKDPAVIYVGTGEVYGYHATERGFDARDSRGNYGIGILRSTDGGKTWAKSLDWQPANRTGVQDLAIVPDIGDPQRFTVWAATSEGIYRLDTAKGARLEDWGKPSLPVVAATSLSVNPLQPDEVVAACGDFGSPGNGIYKTTDGGRSWRKIVRGLPVSFRGKAVLARSPSKPEEIYATIGNLDTLLFSSAGVESTGTGKTAPQNIYKCFYAPTPTLEPSSWVVRSVDGGESWQIRSSRYDNGDSQGWYAQAVAVDPSNPDSLLLGYTAPYRSFDGGATLVQTWAGTRLFNQAVYDQANPSQIFVDFHAIAFAAASSHVVYYACDQGVYRSDDSGRSAVRVNLGLDLMQFYRGVAQSVKDRNFLAGNAQDYGPGFMRYSGSKNGRGQWAIEPGYGYEVGYSSFDDKHGILFTGQHTNRRLARWLKDVPSCKDVPCRKEVPSCKDVPPCQQIDKPTTDGGKCLIPDVNAFQRSTNCLDNTSYNAPLIVSSANPAVLYAARDVLYRSDRVQEHSWADDSGDDVEQDCVSNQAPGVTWAPTGNGEDLDGNPIFSLAISPTDENRLVIATAPRYQRMNVFASDDGGRRWRRLTANLPPDALPMALVLDPSDERIVYLALGGYRVPHVWRLDTRHGKEWQNLDQGAGKLPEVWASGLVVDPKHPGSLYVATDLGVFGSTDGGGSWQSWSEGLYPAVMSVELLLFERDRLLRLVTHGNGVWERQLPP
jgi:photosystem II stability/assembly factor-like uncharacterized protein